MDIDIVSRFEMCQEKAEHLGLKIISTNRVFVIVNHKGHTIYSDEHLTTINGFLDGIRMDY